jgi:hypothetical protein
VIGTVSGLGGGGLLVCGAGVKVKAVEGRGVISLVGLIGDGLSSGWSSLCEEKY